MGKEFTEEDFSLELHKVELKEGMRVICENGAYGVVSGLKAKLGEDYCVIELMEPDKHGCKILEVRRASSNYVTPPRIPRGFLAPGVRETFNYQCQKCKAKYGTEPSYCHGCGSNHISKIETCHE